MNRSFAAQGKRWSSGPALALLSGLLAGCAFPPVHQPLLALFAFLPLYFAIRGARGWRAAALYGFIAGAAAGLIVTWPLSTASAWTGWSQAVGEEIAAARSEREWFLRALWFYMAIFGGGLFWSAFSALLKAASRIGGPGAYLVFAPALWVAMVEWLRSQFMLDYLWMPIGTPLLALPWLAQAAALGGIWLLDGLVLLINGALFLLVSGWKRPGALKAPIMAIVLLAPLSGYGWLRIERVEKAPEPLGAAAIQFSQAEYTPGDYTDFWMDRHYLRFVGQAFERFSSRFELLVLPESIGYGSVSIDGTRSRNLPDKTLSSIGRWAGALRPLLGEKSILVLGIDTVERGTDHNSMTVWTREGLAGLYHKRRLVPFAEYAPGGGLFEQTGQALYAPGAGPQVIEARGIRFGLFICQEVLFPGTIRESVLGGANLLVSGGNDGVFSSPAVAQVNADAARIRAIESGRYMVRAMKSGISAIISPTGKVLTSAGVGARGLIYHPIALQEALTPFARHGNWFIYLSALTLAGWSTLLLFRRRRKGGRGGG